jgi:hypothetical protein
MSKQSKGDTTIYLLRDIPRDVWRRARSRAVLEGRSMREVIIDLLDQWAPTGGFVEQSAPKRKKSRR